MDLLKKIKNYTYNQRHCLGEGSFGKVFEGESDAGQKVAIKKVEQTTVNKDPYLKASLETEITIMKKLRHSNIVRLEDVVQTANSIYLIMEFCAGGDLRRHCRGRKLTEEEALNIIRQVCCGFQEVTARGIIHRDLKPANILIHEGVFKLCDFGFARFFGGEKRMALTCVGTPLYMSPQVLSQKPYTQKSDIWSLGILLFELLSGRLPYSGANEEELFRNISRHQLLLPPCSELTTTLLRGTLQIDEAQRWSWDKLFEHLGLQSSDDPQRKLPDPSLRHIKSDKGIDRNEKPEKIEKAPSRQGDPPKPKPRNLLAMHSEDHIPSPPPNESQPEENPRFLYFLLLELLLSNESAPTLQALIASLYKHTLLLYQKKITAETGLYAKVLKAELEELKTIHSEIPSVSIEDPRKLAETLLTEAPNANFTFWIQRYLQKEYKYSKNDTKTQ